MYSVKMTCYETLIIKTIKKIKEKNMSTQTAVHISIDYNQSTHSLCGNILNCIVVRFTQT